MEVDELLKMNFEDFCRFNNIIISFSDILPNKLKGMCVHTTEYYEIVINSKLYLSILKLSYKSIFKKKPYCMS